jgi:ribosomal protein S18 acetylase RimI-like enzyme
LDEYRFAKISELDDEGLKQLAVLHRAVMHTLLSDLGLPIVFKYYQAARSDLSVVGISALDPSSKILGWAIGSHDPAAINTRLRSPLPWFLLQMLRVAATRPMVFKQLVSSVFTSLAQMEADAIELTYIGVASSQQGKGLGRELLNKFVEESRVKGYHSVVLSVEDENKAALTLYEKSGFHITRSFAEGRFQRHRMELILA